MTSKALAELGDLVNKSRASAVSHEQELLAFEVFYQMLTRLIRKQAPEFLDIMSHLGEPFLAAIAHERTLSAAEARLAEDLNDLSVRYEVVQRVTDEANEARAKVKQCTQKIASLKASLQKDEQKGGLNKVKLESDIRGSIEAKRRAIDTAEAKMEELIRYRQGYNDFKIRRLRHGYQNLGTAVAETTRAIQSELAELMVRIQRVREGLDAVLDGGVPPGVEQDEEEEEPP
jgi:DNA anti-recombination protein RmuC